jgi:hypothetical protein
MMESTVEVFVDARKAFTWKGDQETVERIFEAFPRAAENVGLTERQYADNCVDHLVRLGVLSNDPAGRELQVIGVLWHILRSKSENPDLPGRLASYVGAADFTVDLHETKVEGGVEVAFNIIVSPHEAGLA